MKTPTLTSLRRLAAKRIGVSPRAVLVCLYGQPDGDGWRAETVTTSEHILGPTRSTERAALLALARELRK
jgi:hypothetical protein